ncbi:unnamed protein product [Lactuca virosa]|uniref:Uncharacterized protein n=1 Tax=Lactuca virosa TaxID=75947 RepID=A0AAU9LLG9_9ASTR|nr:unnamed protein product [Lactuca virosa]
MLSMLYIEIVFSPSHLSSPSPNPYIFITDSSSPFFSFGQLLAVAVIGLLSPSSACHLHCHHCFKVCFDFWVQFDAFFKLLMPSLNSSAPSVIQATKVDVYSLLFDASSHEIFPFEGLPPDCV